MSDSDSETEVTERTSLMSTHVEQSQGRERTSPINDVESPSHQEGNGGISNSLGTAFSNPRDQEQVLGTS